MYSEKLEKLIEMALMDGELTDKEKQILSKNAESMGVDLDEFEMVLEARLFEKQKSMEDDNPKTSEVAPKSDKLGDVKKCPACGAYVDSFQTRCQDCGHEFRNIANAHIVDDLMRKLQEAEQLAFNSKPKIDFLGSIQRFTDAESYNKGKAMDAKSKVISTFPVPNTKEDFLEILSLALSQVNSTKVHFAEKLQGTSGVASYNLRYREAWKALSEKIIVKARFAMRDDKNTLLEIERYAKQLKIK